jgi:hypothetical protein
MLRNSQGKPAFWRISTTNDPNDKTIQIQTDYPFVFVYTSNTGAPLGVSQAPTGVWSPLIATWTFPQIPYPTSINVEILDGGSHQSYGSEVLSVFGGDVFRMRITYPSTESNNPAGHGYIDAMVDGQRMTIYGENYLQQEFYHDDVWTRGSGN